MKKYILTLFAFIFMLNCTIKAEEYVIISEILYDSPMNEDPLQIPYCFGEFIELYNTHEEPVDLTGWQLLTQIPEQNYTFPKVILPPKSFLIVAFGEPYTFSNFTPQEDKEDGWTDFHIVFDLEPEDRLILFQTQMMLPNDSCTVLLKDNIGKTRDYVRYGEMSEWDAMIATNDNYTNIISFFNNSHLVYSIQRISATFDPLACTIFHPSDWIGKARPGERDPNYGLNSPFRSDMPININRDSQGADTPIRDCNYIVVITPTVKMDSIHIVDDEIQLDNLSAIVEINYFDGLGLPTQTIQKGFTPSGSDLITIIEYDLFGRMEKQWLPAPVATDNNGAFVDFSSFKSGSETFYGDNRPFAETLYEPSPLNRVLGNKAPGAAWAAKPTSVAYQSNEATEVMYFYVENNQLKRNAFYNANSLYKTQTKDEDGKAAYEYKDKLGQLVMMRQLNGSAPSAANNHDTYYVYDDFGRLRYVLPPMASDGLKNNTGIIPDSNDQLKKYAYSYKYDNRGRNIEKRLPGCEPVYMVYDKADRLIFSKDGKQAPLGEWTYYKYDKLGRLIVSGTCGSEFTESIMRDQIKNEIITENKVNSGYGYTQLPIPGGAYIELLTVNYYDDYDFLNLPAYNTIKAGLQYDNTKTGYGQKYNNNKGLLTGTRTYLLDGSGDYLTTVYYYDYKGQMVQTRSTNHLGGYDITHTAYNFDGTVNKTLKQQTAANSLITCSTSELYTYTYDHAGRLIDTKYQINNKPEILLSSNSYDELGRLENKERHNGEDTEVFEYNIRNWTTRIQSGDFEQNLYYNTGLPSRTPACYNGNIAYSTWTYNGTLKGYEYRYDYLNRLSSANFRQTGKNNHFNEEFVYDKHGNIRWMARYNNGYQIDLLDMSNYNGNQLIGILDEAGNQNQYGLKEYHSAVPYSYDTKFTYDANGNMTADLDRDIVTIKYNLLNLPELVQFRNGNQIINSYDASGRKLRTDYFTVLRAVLQPLNPGETCQLEFQTDVIDQKASIYMDNIEYELHKDPDMSTQSDWISLSKIHNAEGYADNLSISYGPIYYYYRRDHLGNNREVWRAPYTRNNKLYAGATVQRTQYYPSGLPWAEGTGAGVQPYKHNGTEFVEMHGYDISDHGNRGLHHASGRYTTIDRFAEKFPWQSPYVHAGNNPVRNIDVNGDLPILAVMAIKGVIGGVVDAAAQITVSRATGQSFGEALGNIDYTSVGTSMFTSAIAGPGMSTSAKVVTGIAVAVDAAVDISSNKGVEVVFTENKSLANAAIDVASSVLPGKVVDNVTTGFNKAVMSDLTANSAATLTKETKSSLVQAVTTVNSTVVQTGANAVADYVGGVTGNQFNNEINSGTKHNPPAPIQNSLIQQNDATRVHNNFLLFER